MSCQSAIQRRGFTKGVHDLHPKMIVTKVSSCFNARYVVLCRHVGDLGNVEQDTDGKVDTVIKDKVVSLAGEYSVIGKSIVVSSRSYVGALPANRDRGGEGERTPGHSRL